MKRNSIYKQIALSLLLLVGAVGSAWGQQITFYHDVDALKSKTIGIDDKYSQYFKLQGGLQPTHEYTKTIYVKAGEGKQLEPYAMTANYMNTYLRWFVKGDENGSVRWLKDNTNIEELKHYVVDGTEPVTTTEVPSYSETTAGYAAFGIKTWKTEDGDSGPTNAMCYPTLTLTDITDGLTLVMEASNDPSITGTPADNSLTEPILAYRYLLEIKDIDDFMAEVNTSGYIDKVRKRVDATAGMFFQVRLTQPLNNYWGTKTGDTATEGYLAQADVTLEVTAPSGANTDKIYIDDTGKILIIEDPKEGEYTVTLKNGGIPLDEYVITFLPISEAGMFLDKDLTEGSTYYKLSEAYLDSLEQERELQSLGKIDFDDDEYLNHLADYNNEDDAYYPYPILPWSQSSYAWSWSTQATTDFDYAAYRIATTSNATNYHSFVEAVGETVYGHGAHSQRAGEDAFMYNNVANEPGKMLELVWPETICSGCRLYMTFCMNEFSTGETGNVEIAVTGVKEDGTREVLQTYITGYIPKYYSVTNTNEEIIADTSEEPERKHPLYYKSTSDYTQCRGEWMQVYYSFTPNFDPADYTSFVFTINNNTKTSGGADFALDDFHVYMGTLQVEAETVEPACAIGDDAAIKLKFEFERLINRVWGDAEEDDDEAKTGYYCFLDKTKYDETYNNTPENASAAFQAALVHGDGVYMHVEGSEISQNDNFGTFTFYKNPDQNQGDPDDGIADMETEGNTQWLTFISHIRTGEGDVPLMTGEDYYVLYTEGPIDAEATIETLAGIFNPEDPCTVKGEFTVEGPMIIRENGQLSNNSNVPCIGQEPNVSIEMQDADGNIVEGARFDWFFGSIDDYNDLQKTDDEVNPLTEALEMFRHFYPIKTEIDDDVVVQTEGTYNLTEEMIELLKTLSEDVPEDYLNPQLTLSASDNLNIRLTQEETKIVIIPIGEEPTPEAGGTYSKLCWNPTEITLNAQGGAPLLDVGFDEVEYPDYPVGQHVNVRADLARLNEIQTNKMALHVPVKNPRIIDEETGETTKQTVMNTDSKVLYLVSTTDPNIDLKNDEGVEEPILVGEIDDFIINPTSSEQGYVHLRFSNNESDGTTKITFREGYRYDFSLDFKLQSGQDDPLCNGNLIIPVLVVPAYEKWVGGTTGNWNDDENWERSDKDELKKSESYTTNEVNYENAEINTGNGFVPLSTTYVTIPRDKQIQLYNPTKKDDQSGILNLEEGKDGTNIDDAINYIEYDLVIEEKSRDLNEGGKEYQVGKYYTNRANEIHFEPHAEMLYAELLDYNKAWVDYELEKGRWYTLASPLNGVVAGDFYTDSETGTEEQEYFTPITFVKEENNDVDYNNDDEENNRFEPSVYQRGWKESNTMVIKGENDSKDVAIAAGIWSGAYNDVKELYTPGTGFSLKVQDFTNEDNGNKAIFRLPKADKEYGYFEYNETTATTTETIDRGEEGIGKLKSDDLKEAEEGSFTVDLPEANGNYYLIGNPFMTSLNMEAFFESNNGLQKKYWMVTEKNQEVAVGNDEDWISIGEGSSHIVLPLHSFFVVKDNTASSDISNVTFTKKMQTLEETANFLFEKYTEMYQSVQFFYMKVL